MTSYVPLPLCPQQSHDVGGIITPISQMRKLRPRESKTLGQGHRARAGQQSPICQTLKSILQTWELCLWGVPPLHTLGLLFGKFLQMEKTLLSPREEQSLPENTSLGTTGQSLLQGRDSVERWPEGRMCLGGQRPPAGPPLRSDLQQLSLRWK